MTAVERLRARIASQAAELDRLRAAAHAVIDAADGVRASHNLGPVRGKVELMREVLGAPPPST